MKTIESFQLGLLRTAWTTFETKNCPARTLLGGCSSNSTPPKPKAGSTNDTGGSWPAAASAKNWLIGRRCSERNARKLNVDGASAK